MIVYKQLYLLLYSKLYYSQWTTWEPSKTRKNYSEFKNLKYNCK